MFITNQKLKIIFIDDAFILEHGFSKSDELIGECGLGIVTSIVSPKTIEEKTIILNLREKIIKVQPDKYFQYILRSGQDIYSLDFYKASLQCIIFTLRISNEFLIDRKSINVVPPKLVAFADGFAKHFLREKLVANQKPTIAKDNPKLVSLMSSKEKRPKILVVDDSQVNRDVIDIFLSNEFPSPIFAKDGIEALKVLQEHALDLILMDIHMPQMNGIITTKAIRDSHTPWRNIPIIALTADTNYFSKQIYQPLGFDGLLPKPIRQDALRSKLLDVMKTGCALRNNETRISSTVA